MPSLFFWGELLLKISIKKLVLFLLSGLSSKKLGSSIFLKNDSHCFFTTIAFEIALYIFHEHISGLVLVVNIFFDCSR